MPSLFRSILRLGRTLAQFTPPRHCHQDSGGRCSCSPFPQCSLSAASAAMASRLRRTLPCLEATDPERPPPALSSDLLEEIFLRVASPADLARASTACVSFRRLISDPSFLRRYRSIHPPLLLGLISDAGFTPAEAPHPSAALGRAIAPAADFTFNYLPRRAYDYDECLWHLCDVSDGRALFQRSRDDTLLSVFYMDIAVCDPLSQRYLLLPPITHDKLASVGFPELNVMHSGVSFIPSGGLEETSFSVISWIYCRTRLAVFAFTSSSGSWSVGTSTGLDGLCLHYCGFNSLYSVQCVYGHIYWKSWLTSKLIKLDMNSMEFSTINLPPDHDRRNIIIMESCGGKIAMFSMMDEGTSVDYYILSQNGKEKSHEWHMMSTIPLPTDYILNNIKGPAEGYIFLECIAIEQSAELSGVFSLEIKSFKIERVCMPCFGFWGYPYFGFPPSLTSKRIQGYGED